MFLLVAPRICFFVVVAGSAGAMVLLFCESLFLSVTYVSESVPDSTKLRTFFLVQSLGSLSLLSHLEDLRRRKNTEYL